VSTTRRPRPKPVVLTRYHEPMRARNSTATEDFEVELTEDEHGTEMCERWADRLALARMHFARGDLKACQREIDEAARYAALASLAALLSVALSALRRFLDICLGL